MEHFGNDQRKTREAPLLKGKLGLKKRFQKRENGKLIPLGRGANQKNLSPR